ncbi:MAG: hypothetical protein ACL7AX_03710 [Candidatus Arsenophonus phytopathogenicus]
MHKDAERDFAEARMTTHTKRVRYLHPSSQRELSVMQDIQNANEASPALTTRLY